MGQGAVRFGGLVLAQVRSGPVGLGMVTLVQK